MRRNTSSAAVARPFQSGRIWTIRTSFTRTSWVKRELADKRELPQGLERIKSKSPPQATVNAARLVRGPNIQCHAPPVPRGMRGRGTLSHPSATPGLVNRAGQSPEHPPSAASMGGRGALEKSFCAATLPGQTTPPPPPPLGLVGAQHTDRCRHWKAGVAWPLWRRPLRLPSPAAVAHTYPTSRPRHRGMNGCLSACAARGGCGRWVPPCSCLHPPHLWGPQRTGPWGELCPSSAWQGLARPRASNDSREYYAVVPPAVPAGCLVQSAIGDCATRCGRAVLACG